MAKQPQAVLHVINCLRVGGTEHQLLEQLRRLDRRAWRPVVACLQKVGDLLPELCALGCEPIEFPLKGSLEQPNTARQALRLARLIRRENVVLVHAHDFYANLLAVFAAHLARRPVIVSQRDQGTHLSPLQRRGQAFARRLATRVLTNAQALARGLGAEGTPEQKIRVVPNGLDLARFDARLRPDPALPPWRGPTVVVVANLYGPQKGHRELLAVAAELADTRFLLCGDGPYRPVLERNVAARGLAERVLFLGQRMDVPAVLARSSCLCHPSYAEGFPNAVLEAFAASRPVVATRVGGIPDLLQEGEQGYLVPPRDAKALRTALESLLHDPARAEAMGQAARRRVEAEFTSAKMAERVAALYEEVAQPTAPGRMRVLRAIRSEEACP